MKYNASFLTIPLLMIWCSACTEDPSLLDSQQISINFIEQVAIPSGFNFEMSYDQALEISIKDSTGSSLRGIPVFFYDLPWYEGGILLGAGISNEAGLVRDKLRIAHGSRALYAYTPADQVVTSQRILLPEKGTTLLYEWGDNPSPYDTLAYRLTDPAVEESPTGYECIRRALSNEDLEEFDTGMYISREESNAGKFSLIYDESDIAGWATSSTEKQIELWISGHEGHVSHSGLVHAEINAQSEAQLYQDISTLPGSSIHWSVWHKGKKGQDTAGVLIGPAAGTLTKVQEMRTGSASWKNYTGTYTVPLGQTRTRLAFEAMGAAGGNLLEGNFIDLFEVEVCSPSQAENLGDTDADGIADKWDLYPEDGSAATANFFPGAAMFGSYVFEDSWPQKGDYDFNDLVLDYNYEWIKNTQNQIIKARLSFLLTSIGSPQQLGFGISFQDLNDTDIRSVEGTQAPGVSTMGNGIESGTNWPTVIVFDNAHSLFDLSPGVFINSGDIEAEEREAYPLEVIIEFTQALDEVGVLNPFLFTQGIRSRETHLKGFQPTSQANYSFFGTEDDASRGPATYQTSTGLPFMLDLPKAFSPSMEGAVIIDPYPQFTVWVSSNGRDQLDWYNRAKSKLPLLNPRFR